MGGGGCPPPIRFCSGIMGDFHRSRDPSYEQGEFVMTPWSEACLLYLNLKKILAVINATYAVAKRKPEKIRLAGTRTLTSAIPVQCSNQLS